MSKWEPEHDAVRVLINVGDLSPLEERRPTDEIYPLSDFPAVRAPDPDRHPVLHRGRRPRRRAQVRRALLRKLGKESDIGVPVVVDGAVWGEIWATTGPGAPRFRAGDVRFLEGIAAQLAGVIARAELFSDVTRLAYEDPLTGLPNRRGARGAAGGGDRSAGGATARRWA